MTGTTSQIDLILPGDADLLGVSLSVARALCKTGEAASVLVEQLVRSRRPIDPLELQLPGLCAHRAHLGIQDMLRCSSNLEKRAEALLNDIDFLQAVNREMLRKATRIVVPQNDDLNALRLALHASRS